jgi:ribonuclease D
MAVEWVRRTAELAAAIEGIGTGPLSLDTEADSFHRYRERVCLLQLSFGGRDLLVDPLEGVDPEPLRSVLGDAGLPKILHGADYDLRLLHREYGLVIRGLFDTMVAARLCGERSFGLAALLGSYLGVQADKRHQRADWAVRPLPPALVDYAALDTRHLERLAALLSRKLEGLGRLGWAVEEFRRLETVRWSAPARAPDGFLRVKGAARLDRRALAVLRELHELRERWAVERDRPPFRIARDEVLLELARRAPRGPEELGGIAGLPRSWSSGAACERVLAAVARGRAVGEDRLPRRPDAPAAPRRSPASEERLRRLARARDRLAVQLDLDPSLLAPRALLERSLDCLESGADPAGIPEMRSWQLDLLRPIFREA